MNIDEREIKALKEENRELNDYVVKLETILVQHKIPLPVGEGYTKEELLNFAAAEIIRTEAEMDKKEAQKAKRFEDDTPTEQLKSSMAPKTTIALPEPDPTVVDKAIKAAEESESSTPKPSILNRFATESNIIDLNEDEDEDEYDDEDEDDDYEDEEEEEENDLVGPDENGEYPDPAPLYKFFKKRQ